MKVYLLWGDEPYEPSQVIGVYLNVQDAHKKCLELQEEYKIWQERLNSESTAEYEWPKYTCQFYRVQEQEVIQ